jgi:hypothetical protein
MVLPSACETGLRKLPAFHFHPQPIVDVKLEHTLESAYE